MNKSNNGINITLKLVTKLVDKTIPPAKYIGLIDEV